MSTTNPFDFDTILKAYPNFTAQSQEASRIFLEATTGIVKEQAAAAETAVDYGMRAFRLPEGSDAADVIADRVQQQRQFLEAMGESAERILSIATDAGTKAFNLLAESSKAATDEAA
jgi:hypothetical protein